MKTSDFLTSLGNKIYPASDIICAALARFWPKHAKIVSNETELAISGSYEKILLFGVKVRNYPVRPKTSINQKIENAAG